MHLARALAASDQVDVKSSEAIEPGEHVVRHFSKARCHEEAFLIARRVIGSCGDGVYIERAEGGKRKLFLIFSLVANIGVLAIFKYYNFLNGNLSSFLSGIGYENHIPHLSILLPIGLSFHTFQAMSYTIEVYRGKYKAEHNFGIYALYVMFYPQLVAGPIERPQNVIHQFCEKHRFEYERVVSGLKLMAWGMFKKVVIADRLAIVTDPVFNSPSDYPAITLALATFFFSFQIYCDPSGHRFRPSRRSRRRA